MKESKKFQFDDIKNWVKTVYREKKLNNSIIPVVTKGVMIIYFNLDVNILDTAILNVDVNNDYVQLSTIEFWCVVSDMFVACHSAKSEMQWVAKCDWK